MNTFTDVYEKIFGKLEKNLEHFLVAEMICGKEAHGALKASGGKQYQYARFEDGVSQDITQYSDMTIDQNTGQEIVMDLDTRTGYTFTLDEWDRDKFRRSSEFVIRKYKDARKQMTRDVDGDFLGLVYEDANNSFDDGGIGGTAGSPITLTKGNVIDVFSEAHADVIQRIGSNEDLYAVITPKQSAKMIQSLTEKGFRASDKALHKGYLGDKFLGVSWYLSSYLTHTIVETFGGQPTNGDTYVVNGITLTAVTVIGATPGNFLIGASADDTANNFIGLFNSPSVTSATQVALSPTNQRKFRGLAASNAGSGVVTIVYKRGAMVITNGLTNVTSGTQITHNFLGERGSIELAKPGGIRLRTPQETKQFTDNYLSGIQYGVKTPSFGKDRFLDLQIAV